MISWFPRLADHGVATVLRRHLSQSLEEAWSSAQRHGEQTDLASWIWGGATLLVLSALLLEIVTELTRGSVGLDIIAALAMAGALAVGETLTGIVVALMYSGGQLLEDFAAGRARREMTALLGRVRKTAVRHGRDGLAGADRGARPRRSHFDPARRTCRSTVSSALDRRCWTCRADWQVGPALPQGRRRRAQRLDECG